MRLSSVLAPFVVLASSVALLVGCGSDAPPLDSLESVTFSQSQSVPDFDGSTYTQDDPGEVQKLATLLKKYDVDPGDYRGPDSDGCTGGVTSEVTLSFETLQSRLDIDSCGAEDGTFENDAGDLLSGWRRDLGPQG